MAKAREPKVFRSMDDLPLMLTPYDLMDFLGKGQRQTYELIHSDFRNLGPDGYLTELDIEVDKLRSYLRLSANPELKYLSVDKYGNWAAMVDEIGRMVGGWIQSVSK